MSNYKKMIKAVKDLLEVMLYQEDDVNLIILKSIIEDYGHKCNIAPLQVSKDLFDEFLYHKIERNYEKKLQIKEEKKIEEAKLEKQEKLYTTMQEAYNDYFRDWYLYGREENNETNYIFYKYINKTIWKPFIESHYKEFPHKYQLQ